MPRTRLHVPVLLPFALSRWIDYLENQHSPWYQAVLQSWTLLCKIMSAGSSQQAEQ